ncbi:hypothetical protein SAMN05444166_3388 [Singulisphaera sp. GP187]|nr:hypothetical protein SAMN05444166_3388 [Singulisphaera sp. GP187]
MTADIKYCCPQMDIGLNASRQGRGFAVAVTTAPAFHSGLLFVFEARSVDAADESRLDGQHDIPIALVYRVCIQYCPWCGTRLKAHYARYIHELEIVENLMNLSSMPLPEA